MKGNASSSSQAVRANESSDLSVKISEEEEKETDNDLPDEIIIGDDTTKEFTQSFETLEHIRMGDDAFNFFLESLPAEQRKIIVDYLKLEIVYNEDDGTYQYKTPLILSDDESVVKVSPGEVVALAGDYVAIPEEPICFGDDLKDSSNSKEARFFRSFESLLNPKYYDQIELILDYVKAQGCGCSGQHKGIIYQKEKKPDGVFKSLYKNHAITKGRASSLLLRNFDHFEKEAHVVFLIGLITALKTAKKAHDVSTIEETAIYLHLAFLQAFFACHYLTDAYAGGHVRTPRKQILNAITKNKDGLNATPDLKKISKVNLAIAGLFANTMHDEDNMIGIYVRSALDTEDNKWLAFGDNKYDHDDNIKNKDKIRVAVVQVFRDIFDTFLSEKELTEDVMENLIKDLRKRYVDQFLPLELPKVNEAANRMPLFRVNSNEDDIEFRDKNDHEKYKPINRSSTLFSVIGIKVRKTKAEQPVVLLPEEIEKLAAKLERAEWLQEEDICRVM